MSPMPAALPPFDVTTPTGVHASATAGPAPAALRPAQERSWGEYTVRAGDTLYDLAERHGTTVPELLRRNTLAQGGRWLMPGQRLSVPGSAGASRPDADRSGTAAGTASGTGRTVTVRAGDTLSQIALRHGVSVSALSSANGIRTARFIHPGQVLSLPGEGQATTPARTGRPAPAARAQRTVPTTVTVRPGDTLSAISARQGVSLDALLSANPDLDPRRLWVGQRVSLPSGGSSTASPSAAAAPSPRSGPWTPDTIGDRLADEDVEDTFLHYTYSSAVARSAAANREYLATVPVPDRQGTRDLITRTARRHGVDPALMLALAQQESGWNQRAVSPANAIGIMQVIPTSGEWASQLVGRPLNLLDPQDNVTAGVVIMRALLRSATTEEAAIGGYYQGLGSVQRYGLFADTTRYVASIRSLRAGM